MLRCIPPSISLTSSHRTLTYLQYRYQSSSASPASSSSSSSSSTSSSSSSSAIPKADHSKLRSNDSYRSSNGGDYYSSLARNAANQFSHSAEVDLLTSGGEGRDGGAKSNQLLQGFLSIKNKNHRSSPSPSMSLSSPLSSRQSSLRRSREKIEQEVGDESIKQAEDHGRGMRGARQSTRDDQSGGSTITTTAASLESSSSIEPSTTSYKKWTTQRTASQEPTNHVRSPSSSRSRARANTKQLWSFSGQSESGVEYTIGVHSTHITVDETDSAKTTTTTTGTTIPSPSSTFSSQISFTRLRDSCPCPKCIDPSTRQKLHTSPEAYRWVNDVQVSKLNTDDMFKISEQDGIGGIQVRWFDKLTNVKNEEHVSFYPWELISRLSNPKKTKHYQYLANTLARRLWDRETLISQGSTNLRIPWSDLNIEIDGSQCRPRSDILLRALEQLQIWGIVIFEGVPTDETGDKTCALRHFAQAIGQLRNTFYGETWDVKSMKQSKNVAYTSLNLGLHMDLLYFAYPPRFQILHCLRNRVVGGSSYFVDSFRAAYDLFQTSEASFDRLSRQNFYYEYDNDGHLLKHGHPVFNRQVLPKAVNYKAAVNWSPPFQAPMELSMNFAPAENIIYSALDEFQRLIDRPEMKYELTMREGDMVFFDNRRILHARTAFRDKTAEECERDGTVIVPGEPTRWLKGGYIDGDAVWDKLASLKFGSVTSEGEGSRM